MLPHSKYLHSDACFHVLNTSTLMHVATFEIPPLWYMSPHSKYFHSDACCYVPITSILRHVAMFRVPPLWCIPISQTFLSAGRPGHTCSAWWGLLRDRKRLLQYSPILLTINTLLRWPRRKRRKTKSKHTGLRKSFTSPWKAWIIDQERIWSTFIKYF